ncbi:MAG: hypothetical protein ACRDOD_24125, partial [Streptosporangiaceae bacterium]
LLISLSVGLFGFRESISASDVKASIVVETVATAGLLGWAILAAAPRPGGRAPGLLPRHAVTGPDNGDRRFRLPGWRHR